MKIIHQNLKKGIIKVKTENIDDLWYLSHIIDKNDLIKAQTIRKIKLGEEAERSKKAIKKKVILTIKTEKIEFKDNILRISGTVIEGPEDIPKSSHHSFKIEENDIITIIKEKWLRFQLDKLKEAIESKIPSILICILDREEAIFALSKTRGYKILSSIKGEVTKKEERATTKGGFYQEIIKSLREYAPRYKINNVIIASPAFWKEDLMKEIKDKELKEKIVLASCSSVDKGAINEVLKRPEMREVLKQVRSAKEIELVEELLKEISKQGNSAYGIDEVELAANAGAVKQLLITDSFISKMREQENYERIDNIMKITDQTKGNINIISSEHEGGKKLDGLGGIAAILRFRIS
ncbi:mRNA surveillance protein pelota [Candidatus Woesearchaeota archaeon]|nr:mRNA surveillance protein pelota [Candidatus Woesearchaeota archaeon]